MFVYSGPSLTYLSSVCAIYSKKLLLQLGMKFDTIRSESAIIHAFPFNSEKKRGGVAVLRVIALSFLQFFNLQNFFTFEADYAYTNSLQGDSEVFIHWKGAAEIVLACCTQYMDSNGTLQSIDSQKVR